MPDDLVIGSCSFDGVSAVFGVVSCLFASRSVIF